MKNLLDVQLENAGFLECEVVEAMREYGQIIGKDIEAKQSVPIRIRGRFCLFKCLSDKDIDHVAKMTLFGKFSTAHWSKLWLLILLSGLHK